MRARCLLENLTKELSKAVHVVFLRNMLVLNLALHSLALDRREDVLYSCPAKAKQSPAAGKGWQVDVVQCLENCRSCHGFFSFILKCECG